MKILPRVFVFFAVFHFAASCLYGSVISNKPVQELRVSSFADGLIVFGKNRFGYLSVEYFLNWNNLNSYMIENGYYFDDSISGHESTSFLDSRPLFVRTEVRDNYLSVIWKTRFDQNFPRVIHSPDSETALLFKQAIENGILAPSIFGHAIKILNM